MHGDLLCARLFVGPPISPSNFLYLVRVTAIRRRVVLRLRIRVERQVNGVLLIEGRRFELEHSLPLLVVEERLPDLIIYFVILGQALDPLVDHCAELVSLLFCVLRHDAQIVRHWLAVQLQHPSFALLVEFFVHH